MGTHNSYSKRSQVMHNGDGWGASYPQFFSQVEIKSQLLKTKILDIIIEGTVVNNIGPDRLVVQRL